MTNLKEQRINTQIPIFCNELKNKFVANQFYLKQAQHPKSSSSKNKNKKDCFTSLIEENDSQFYPCSECGEMCAVDDMITTQDNRKICYDCYEKEYTTCEICGAVIPISERNSTAVGFENIETCEDCALQLNTIFKEQDDSITLLHHHSGSDTDFIQLRFHIILCEHLDSVAFLNIVNNICDICNIHDVPLFYLKRIDGFQVLEITTHFLDIHTPVYRKIILKLATYIAFEPDILYLESFQLRMECRKEKEEKCTQQMSTFLTSLLQKVSTSIERMENIDTVELTSNIADVIVNKADFYRVCMQVF